MPTKKPTPTTIALGMLLTVIGLILMIAAAIQYRSTGSLGFYVGAFLMMDIGVILIVIGKIMESKKARKASNKQDSL